MEQEHDSRATTASIESPETYVCPMHPEVRANAPGRCPKCGMNLVLAGTAEPAAEVTVQAEAVFPKSANK